MQPPLQSLDPTKGEQLHDWRELTQIALSLKDIQAATKGSLCHLRLPPSESTHIIRISIMMLRKLSPDFLILGSKYSNASLLNPDLPRKKKEMGKEF